MEQAFIALGSNMGNPADMLERARDAMAGLPKTALGLCSRAIWTPAMIRPGTPPQPEYLNQVVELRTTLGARTLFRALQNVELELGREPVEQRERWGPRAIDLDLLAYGDEVIEERALSVPHPGIADRPFVLGPWREIAPGFVVPSLGLAVSTLHDALRNTPQTIGEGAEA